MWDKDRQHTEPEKDLRPWQRARPGLPARPRPARCTGLRPAKQQTPPAAFQYRALQYRWFRFIAGPGARAQAERRVVGDGDGFCDVASAKQHGDRTKHLFAVDRRVALDVDQHRGLIVIAATGDAFATSQNTGAGSNRSL